MNNRGREEHVINMLGVSNVEDPQVVKDIAEIVNKHEGDIESIVRAIIRIANAYFELTMEESGVTLDDGELFKQLEIASVPCEGNDIRIVTEKALQLQDYLSALHEHSGLNFYVRHEEKFISPADMSTVVGPNTIIYDESKDILHGDSELNTIVSTVAFSSPLVQSLREKLLEHFSKHPNSRWRYDYISRKEPESVRSILLSMAVRRTVHLITPSDLKCEASEFIPHASISNFITDYVPAIAFYRSETHAIVTANLDDEYLHEIQVTFDNQISLRFVHREDVERSEPINLIHLARMQ